MQGHNRLAELGEKARKGLEIVRNGEEKTMKGWLQYGAALNEGRALFPSDEQFGQWVQSNLDHTVHPGDRQAAMWAAEDLERFERIKAKHPRVRTVRGLHAKWKETNPNGLLQKLVADFKAVDDAVEKVLALLGEEPDGRVHHWMLREGQADAYHYAGLALLTFSLLGKDQEKALCKGDLAAYQRMEEMRETCCVAIMLPPAKVKVLEALFFNEEANREGLKAGGDWSRHPLRKAYDTLFEGAGFAEEWCCEAMFEQVLRDDEKREHFDRLLAMKAKRSPFWLLAREAAKCVETTRKENKNVTEVFQP